MFFEIAIAQNSNTKLKFVGDKKHSCSEKIREMKLKRKWAKSSEKQGERNEN